MDLAKKAEEINLILSEPEVNLWKLRELALSEGGLVNDTLRKRAWPKLVGLQGDLRDDEKTSRGNGRPPRTPGQQVKEPSLASAPVLARRDKPEIPQSEDADQIERDVARCTWHLLTGSQRERRRKMRLKHRKKFASLLKRKQRRLGDLINLALVSSYDGHEDDKLRYYQGYHDVASIFLSALGGGQPAPHTLDVTSADEVAASIGLDLPSRVLQRVSETHFRDTMRSSFQDLQTVLRLVLMPMIYTFDPEVHDHLYGCDMEPYFALSWIITWFSHDIRDTDLVKRLYDVFLVSHPMLAVYATVAMVCHPYNRAEILSTECDFASMHHVLSGLPKNSSMVGFIYKLGDGYVSGADDEDDATTSTDPVSSTDLDVSLVEEPVHEADHSVIVSSTPIDSNVKVPFQSIIDTALDYMRRVPPRSLIALAKRYYPEDYVQPMLDKVAAVGLLGRPPRWALIGLATADWVIKQRSRARSGRSKSNRRDRRCPSPMRSRKGQQAVVLGKYSMDVNSDDEIVKYLKQNNCSLAVIACGFGPGDDEKIRRKRKRRKWILIGSATVIVVGVAWVAFMTTETSKNKNAELSSGDKSLALSMPDTNTLPRSSNVVVTELSTDGSVLVSSTEGVGSETLGPKTAFQRPTPDNQFLADPKEAVFTSPQGVSSEKPHEASNEVVLTKKSHTSGQEDSFIPVVTQCDLPRNSKTNIPEAVAGDQPKAMHTKVQKPPRDHSKATDTNEQKVPRNESKAVDTTKQKPPRDQPKAMDTKIQRPPRDQSRAMNTTEQKVPINESKARNANGQKQPRYQPKAMGTKKQTSHRVEPQKVPLRSVHKDSVPKGVQKETFRLESPPITAFRGVKQVSTFVRGQIEQFRSAEEEWQDGKRWSRISRSVRGTVEDARSLQNRVAGLDLSSWVLMRMGAMPAPDFKQEKAIVSRDLPVPVRTASRVLRAARKSFGRLWNCGKDLVHEESSVGYAL